MIHTAATYSCLRNQQSFNDQYLYDYMLFLHLFPDHLQHGPRLWIPMTVLYGDCIGDYQTIMSQLSVILKNVSGFQDPYPLFYAYFIRYSYFLMK